MSELVQAAVVLSVGFAVALILYLAVTHVGRRLVGSAGDGEAAVLRQGRPPLRAFLIVATLYVVRPSLPLPPSLDSVASHALLVALILSLAWLVVGLSAVIEDVVRRRFPTDVEDNLRARRIQTKVQVIRRIITVVTAFVAIAAVLMTFPAAQEVGMSLLASAGVIGLVVGIAARPTLSNLIAGLQVAFTEPIRLDDVVIVDGEWGWIEEINTTHVVVRLWDLRRLVVPLTRFLEESFQNWTRQKSDLLGSVHLHADYRVPVDRVRDELKRILERSDLWDGETWNLQVVDATERTIELRALMSAPDAPTAWNLRCEVREEMLAFLQDEHPASLPRIRAEVQDDAPVRGPVGPEPE